MIKLSIKLPHSVYVAFSGGIDSVAAVKFLMRKHKVSLMFFHHGNDFADQELVFVQNFAAQYGLPLEIGYTTREKAKSESWESYWRDQRYAWFSEKNHDIITCHHLDDCIETWIFTSLHGYGRTIHSRNGNVIRPFLQTKKKDLVRGISDREYIKDPSNSDTKFMRNFIRLEIVERALTVNPGLHKTILKKLRKETKHDYLC